MKHLYLLFFICVLTFSTTLQAESLHFKTKKTLFNHMVEVNQQWLFQEDLNKFNFNQKVDFQNDNERIQQHLQFVYQILSERSTTDLTTIQKVNRQKHLAVLKSYYETAVFPTNHYHSVRQPYFVDNYNVHCAVGYLLQQDGQVDFVNTIRANDNYAYIHELTKYSELENWAKANGFTIDELAWIQPGYQPTNQFLPVGNGGGVDGEILCFAKSDNDSTLYIGGNFTIIDGTTAASLAIFDGTSFQEISGISGTIHDMKFHNGKLYIVGNFSIGGMPTNIAVWDGTNWTTLQNGDMQGTIYTIEVNWSILYIGGDFQKVNNANMPYLAFLNLSTMQWGNHGRMLVNSNYVDIPNGFSVNAPVYDLELNQNVLMVGGDFTEVGSTASDSTFTKFTTSHVAYWNINTEWTQGFNIFNSPVRSVRFINGNLYTGGLVSNASSIISVLTAGVWSSTYNIGGIDDYMTHDFFEFNSKIYALGGITFAPFVGYFGNGILEVTTGIGTVGFQGAGIADGSIKTAIEFQNKAYFGGNFNSISGSPVNGLAVSDLDNVSNTENIKDKKSHNVWYASKHIIIKSEQIQPTDFMLYNVNGQKVYQTQNIRSERYEVPVYNLPKGIYFYEIRNENGRESGKIQIY